MVWGQAYGDVSSSAALDPFAVAERDVRAMVTAAWWPATPPLQRQNLIAGRILALPDGTWWLFGAWARWYRWAPNDRQWYLCPPPGHPMNRMAARPLQPGMPVPGIPPHLVPAGPDFGAPPPDPLPFVDTGVRPEITARVRATVASAAALPPHDYPHRWEAFSTAAPSTVVVTWGVMLWSAAAPVFDACLDEQLLDVWSPYRSRPLPDIGGPRWLTPPPLAALVGLYAERLRAGRADAAVVVLRTMWAAASALREDARFRARADALLAVLGATLQNPAADYGALPYGDAAIVQQWLTRCPVGLAPALRAEASAGEHFRGCWYELARAVAAIAGDPSGSEYAEPRLLASAFLAADLAVVRRDVAGQVAGWLDPEIRYTVQLLMGAPDHPLRRAWPEGDRLPRYLRERVAALEPSQRATLLAAVYALDLSWCRLGGGIPARPRGFPVPTAILAEILGPERATSTAAAEPPTPVPGLAPPAPHYPADPAAPGQPPLAPAARRPPTGPPGQAPGWAAPTGRALSPPAPPGETTRAWTGTGDPVIASGGAAGAAAGDDSVDVSGEETVDPGELTMLDPEPPAPPGPPPAPPGSPGAAMPPGPSMPPGPEPYETQADPLGGTRADPVVPEAPPPAATPETAGSGAIAPQPAPPARAGARTDGPPERPGTRIMSGTLIGDLLGGPAPGAPVEAVAPPPSGAVVPEVTEHYGIGFVSGADGVAALLDDVRRRAARAVPPGGAEPPPGGDVGMPDAGATESDIACPDPAADGGVPAPGGGQVSGAGVPASDGGGQVSGAGVPASDGGGQVSGAGAPTPGAGRPGPAPDSRVSVSDAAPPAPAILLVGAPHSGQRRLTRLVARALAEVGTGDGAVRTADGAALSGDPAIALTGLLSAAGPPLLLEHIDMAVLRAPDPARAAEAVTRARAEPGGPPLVATCEPAAYTRLAAEFPALLPGFRVFRLPDLGGLETRLALIHLLADERRVTLDAAGLQSAQRDLPRLRGRGDLAGARLVEAYLDRAVARHVERAGAAHDRLVLAARDFAGVAEDIEPALRAPGDVDGFLRSLDEMIGLEEVKSAVRDLAATARGARARVAFAGAAGASGSAERPRHLIFLGRAGTGKRTVAGLVGAVYAALNLLDSGHLVRCDAGELGDDPGPTVGRLAGRAAGGVLLAENAELLGRAPGAVAALRRVIEDRGDELLVVCAGEPEPLRAFLTADPEFGAAFGPPVPFREPTDRELVRMFSRFADRDLYLPDEELRVDLLGRLGELRRMPDFAFADTVRRLFDETVARQAARLAGSRVDPSSVARLTARDLPEPPVGSAAYGRYEHRSRG